MSEQQKKMWEAVNKFLDEFFLSVFCRFIAVTFP